MQVAKLHPPAGKIEDITTSLNKLILVLEETNNNLQTEDAALSATISSTKKINAKIEILTDKIDKVHHEVSTNIGNSIKKLNSSLAELDEAIQELGPSVSAQISSALSAQLRNFAQGSTNIQHSIQKTISATVDRFDSPLARLDKASARLLKASERLDIRLDETRLQKLADALEKLNSSINHFNLNITNMVDKQQSEISRAVYSNIQHSIIKNMRLGTLTTVLLSSFVSFLVIISLILLSII